MRPIFFAFMFFLTACSGQAPTAPGDVRPQIASTDFALLPCAAPDAEAPCVLVVAGGKRILFGAPAGIATALHQEDLANLDAAMLFSLRASDLQGLDELRNGSWAAGRAQPLAISGPPGTRDILVAINKIYETSDAQIFVETGGAGGFDAPMLRPSPGEKDTKAKVFDSGDLVVTHLVNVEGRVGYWVDYNGQRVVIEPCGMGQALKFAERVDFALVCELPEETVGLTWPIETVAFIRPDAP